MTANPATPKIDRIGQIAVRVRDLDRAVLFYEKTLGLPFLFRVPGMAFFDCGGIRLLLSVPEAPEFDHPASIIYYQVADIHAARDAIGSQGVAFHGEPHLVARLPDHDLWMAFFRDSEENVVGLMSEVRS